MATRNFCDWCDNEIAKDSPYFTMELTATNIENRYYNDREPTIYENGKTIQVTTTANMVCVKCASALRSTIHACQTVRDKPAE